MLILAHALDDRGRVKANSRELVDIRENQQVAVGIYGQPAGSKSCDVFPDIDLPKGSFSTYPLGISRIELNGSDLRRISCLVVSDQPFTLTQYRENPGTEEVESKQDVPSQAATAKFLAELGVLLPPAPVASATAA